MSWSRNASPSMSTGECLDTESGSVKDGSGLVGCRLRSVLFPDKTWLTPSSVYVLEDLLNTSAVTKLEGAGLCSSGTSVSQEDPGHDRVQGKGFLGSRTWNKNPFPDPVEYESAKGQFPRRTEHRPTTPWYGYVITYVGMGMLLPIPRK